MKKLFFLICVVAVVSFDISAQTAVRSGNWNGAGEDNIWQNGVTRNATIGNGQTVNIGALCTNCPVRADEEKDIVYVGNVDSGFNGSALTLVSNTSATLNVRKNNILLIFGNLNIGKDNRINIEDDGVIIVYGNLEGSEPHVNVSNGGLLVVMGETNLQNGRGSTNGLRFGDETYAIGECSGRCDDTKNKNAFESRYGGTFIGDLTATPSNALSTTIHHFTAAKGDFSTTLSWFAPYHHDVSHFQISVKTPGKQDFETVSTVNALEQDVYAFDYAPKANGMYLLKIEARGFDGEIFSTATTTYLHAGIAQEMKMYPNPSNGQQLNLTFMGDMADDTKVMVRNAAGFIVHETAVSNTSELNIQFNNTLSSGMYFVEVVNGDYKNQQKLMVK